MYTKNILILLLFYLFQLFFLKNYFNFLMFQDVSECSVMFCVLRFIVLCYVIYFVIINVYKKYFNIIVILFISVIFS